MNTEEMKKILNWTWIALIVLVVFLGAHTLGALKDLKKNDPMFNSISVSGVGEVMAVPDIGTFSFSVSADAATVSAAQESVTKKIDAIIVGLKSIGIEEKDIKTSNYNVYPKYRYESGVCGPNYCPPSKQVPDGYTASHNISVKVRDTQKAGEAIAVAGENGATDISGISFTIDDPDKLMEEAQAMAIEDAKAKAKRLAKELDVRLVKIISFYDNSGGPMPYYNEVMGMGAADMAVKSSARPPTLPTGENQYTSNVTITYEIR